MRYRATCRDVMNGVRKSLRRHADATVIDLDIASLDTHPMLKLNALCSIS